MKVFGKLWLSVWLYLMILLRGMALGGISLNSPEKLLKSETTPYGYTWGDGYQNKYTKEDR